MEMMSWKKDGELFLGSILETLETSCLVCWLVNSAAESSHLFGRCTRQAVTFDTFMDWRGELMSTG